MEIIQNDVYICYSYCNYLIEAEYFHFYSLLEVLRAWS